MPLQTQQHDARTGMVYLVGAGPGDPGMLTLRGAECIRRADVILYDYLVNPRILRHARGDCELVCLGRHGKGRIWSQEEINLRLVELAQAGRTVVRLKGGDPAVFARGAEEAEVLSKSGVPFEIVPGITAALAAGSCAGVPITHRDFASAAALITAHEDPDKGESRLDYEALARFPGTLVFYMGVTSAPVWTAALIAAGKPADTPVALIRRCGFPDQRTIHCTLAEVPTRLTTPEIIRPPVIAIVGQVATLAETLSWFDRRPLFGLKVMISRPAGQSSELADALAELGAEPIEQPAIVIGPPEDIASLDTALDQLDEFDWLVFSSANGVRWLLDRLDHLGRDTRALGGVKLAAIGPGTEQALAAYHLRADLVPETYRAEALAEALSGEAKGRRFLLARASRGREVLAEQLTAAGGLVEQVVVYSSSDVQQANPETARLMAEGKIDWVAVTSSAIARSLVHLFGEDLRKTRLASISPITSQTLRDLGYPPTAEASEYTMPGVVEAIRVATEAEGD